MFKKLSLFCIATLFCITALPAQNWCRQQLQSLSLVDKISQLFVIPVPSNASEAYIQKVETLLQQYAIGSIILMSGTPEQQIPIINRLQAISKVPLLTCQDLEWGLSQRLSNTLSFPHNLTLGAIRDTALLEKLGEEMGRQCQLVGIHMNFAPVLDVNLTPENPVIHHRSFGENPIDVGHKACAFIQGMQRQGVIVCAKHFPGHGDATQDSHHELPLIPHDLQRLHAVELLPFKQAIAQKVGAIMTAHLLVPALDPAQPTSLSPAAVTHLLRHSLGFSGLIVTDSLAMAAIRHRYPHQSTPLRALLAGNDMLLACADSESKNQLILKALPEAIEQIHQAVRNHQISQLTLNTHLLRILHAKEQVGLSQKWPPLSLPTHDQLFNAQAIALKKELFEAALTLVKNDAALLPLDPQKSEKLAAVVPADRLNGTFQQFLTEQSALPVFPLPQIDPTELLPQLDKFDTIILTAYESIKSLQIEASKHGLQNRLLTPGIQTLSQTLAAAGKKVILVLFASPYQLKDFGTETALLVAYEDDPVAERAAVDMLWGKIEPKGRLPVTASAQFVCGTGL